MKAEKNAYDVVLRQENNHIIIWSKKLCCYLFPTTEISKQFINTVFESQKKLFDIDNKFNASLIRDLELIGFSKKIRKINLIQFKLVPLEVYFDYTHNCNLSCCYCYNKTSNIDITMSKKNISKIIFELWKHGIYRLHLAGGEPTLYKDNLYTYISLSCKYNLCTSITTNGLFDDDCILEFLIINNIYSITYSLHRFSVSKVDSLSKKIAINISKTVSLKKRLNSNVLINLKVVWNNDTSIAEIEEYIKMAITLGVNAIKLSSPEKNINYYQNISYSYFYYKKLKEIIILKEKYHKQIAIILVSNPIFNKTIIGIPGRFGCIGGQELITIMPDSSITPCAINKIGLGNLFEDYNGNLSYFLTSQIWHDYIENIQGNIKESECKTCDLLQYCRGGSQFRVNSNESKFDLLCPMKNKFEMGVNVFQTELPSIDNHLQNFQVIKVCHS